MVNIIEILDSMKLDRGFSPTALKSVRLFKEEIYCSRVPLIYDPSICFILQGSKTGYMEDYQFQYNADSYLVVSVASPLEMDTIASPEKPLYGLSLTIDPVELNNIIALIRQSSPDYGFEEKALSSALGPSVMSTEMKESLFRLIRALRSETDAKVLGPGLIREIYYHALQGNKGYLLYRLSQHDGNFSRIISVMTQLYNHYGEKFTVEGLAEQVNMSVSAFHRAFKSIASETPVQYQKKIRLNKAREFLLEKKMKSYEIAETVGYESPAQFSRDFKKFYGYSTAELLRTMR
ncbi:MAG: AraC family transcriptional regulator [Spirochaetales bacterium]|nr:AraC family transcriptional regulator [Spirochaetales bacterium]